MVVGYKSSTFYDEIKLTNQDILITGDRYKILNYSIESKVWFKADNIDFSTYFSTL